MVKHFSRYLRKVDIWGRGGMIQHRYTVIVSLVTWQLGIKQTNEVEYEGIVTVMVKQELQDRMHDSLSADISTDISTA